MTLEVSASSSGSPVIWLKWQSGAHNQVSKNEADIRAENADLGLSDLWTRNSSKPGQSVLQTSIGLHD